MSAQDETQIPTRKPMSRGAKWALGIAAMWALVTLVGVGILVWQNLESGHDTVVAQTNEKAAVEESKDLAAEVDRICQTSTAEAKNLKAAGKCEQAKQVIERPGPAGPQGDPGAPGRPPTASEVAQAVASFCAVRSQCRGPVGSTGPAGKNAPLPTEAQVAQAVASYCNARGECRGPTGTDGTNGNDGSVGPQGPVGSPGPAGPQGDQGIPGPPPSQAQVSEGVAAYCDGQVDNCQGPAGPAGPAGPKGDPGDPASDTVCPPGTSSKKYSVLTDEGPKLAAICEVDG